MTGCKFQAGASLDAEGLAASVRDCTFDGGALLAESHNVLTVRGNILVGGSGIAVETTPRSISKNTVRNASTGISCRPGEFDVLDNRIENCAIGIDIRYLGFDTRCSGNVVAGCGAGVWIRNSIDEVSGNTVAGCSGTAIRVESALIGELSRNIAATNGAGISVPATADPLVVTCNDVWDNAGGDWTGIADQTGQRGNFSADPLFCFPSGNGYALVSASPCLAGNHPYGADCGLIGAPGQGCAVVSLPDATSPAVGLLSVGLALPNPFQQSVRITFALPVADDPTLTIYDAAGRMVSVLARGPYGAGRHDVEWNEHRVAWDGLAEDGHVVLAGVLFYQLRAGGETLRRKVVRTQ